MGLFNRRKETPQTPGEEATMRNVIDTDALIRANEILRKYKDGKANLEAKLIDNEEYWKLKQWRVRNTKDPYSRATAWLWSCIESRHSDAMDSYPTCNIRPRSSDDGNEADMLSSILPVLFENVDFEKTYSEVSRYTLKHGTGVYGVFWDPQKYNGLGDIVVKRIDLLNLFWEPGITDIQQSTNVFLTDLVDNAILEQRYPELEGKLNGKSFTVSRYLYDDNVDTTNKSVVVDWYYHTEYNGKRQLQYCKYVGTHLLYSTENDTVQPMTQTADPATGAPIMIPAGDAPHDRGHYDHAMYPFVVQPLYPVEGTICGYGLTDIARDTQDNIDDLDRAITKNALVSATPRWFKRKNSSINIEQYADLSNDFIDVEGQLGDEGIRRVETENLSATYLSIEQAKIEELKHITSNQDVMNGAAPSGITAASAIAALQETSGKNARNTNKAFHRAYRDVVYFVIELIRQFYDVPRQFRITGGEVAPVEKFVPYSNANIRGQEQFDTAGNVVGIRVPEFDIEVTSEKANPYKKIEMNELALDFFSRGFFNPQMADQVIPCIQMMDFDGKDEILAKVAQNGTLLKMLNQYQSIALGLAQKYEPNTAEMLSQAILSQGGQPLPMQGGADTFSNDGEHPFVEKSRAAARASTSAE